ncbi:MAG: PP0621 family protein [Betaproteobacteria bacterium]
MGKVIFWVTIVFVVLFVLRLYNAGQFKRRQRRDPPPPAPGGGTGEPMVRCTQCGIYLPRAEAQLIEGKIRCRDLTCH